jgi:hypothetical protein
MTRAYVIVLQEGEAAADTTRRGTVVRRGARTRARGSGHTNATHVNVSPGALCVSLRAWANGGVTGQVPGPRAARSLYYGACRAWWPRSVTSKQGASAPPTNPLGRTREQI